ncbi:MAG: vWA domain-containing protein [Chlorobiaceae bacterium]
MKRYLLMILLLAVFVSGGFFVYKQYETSIPKSFVQSTRPKFDIFLLIDHSGSMKGDRMDPVPSDPDGIRVKAAKYFVDYLQHFSDPSSIHRISIINFGSDTPEDKQIPLTPINTPQKAKEIKDKIQEYSLGYTNFLQAVRKANEFFQKDQIVGDSRQPVIIIFTDGEPKDTRGLSKDAYFNELEDYINSNMKNMKLPGVARQISYKIYVIGLDARGAYWLRDAAQWNKLTSNGASLLAQASEEELEARYGKIIETLFSTQAGEWKDLKAGDELKFIVPPYVEKAIITVKKDLKIQNQKLAIHTPTGELLKEGKKLQSSPGGGITLYAL